MLEKIILGTANFGMPYGILGKNIALGFEQVSAIIKLAKEANINAFDTAYAYGSSLETLKNIFKDLLITKPKIINKFSVQQNYQELFSSIQKYCEEININCLEALLIHDPNNINQVCAKKLQLFVEQLLTAGLVKKIGVSVYDLEEVKLVHNIIPINLVQCPINPLNQYFLQTQAQDFFKQNNIEVHGRSLFLQGILLANSLPKQLEQLYDCWEQYWVLVKSFNMDPLNIILQWANSQSLVDKWVLGVDRISNLQDLINVTLNLNKNNHIPKYMPATIFNSLVNISNPYIDPRNWPKL